MNKRVFANGLFFVVLSAIPLVSELATTPSNLGFDILLYKPFEFAYIFLAGLLFIVLNIYISILNKSTIFMGLVIGISELAVWFLITFILVGQLHITLGGKL